MTTSPEIYILRDADQPRDHNGDAVAPLTSTGQTYLYALRDQQRATTTYATSADALLATLIDDYDPRDLDGTDPQADHDLETTRIRQRARHARSLAIDHAAQAILAGAPTDVITTLQRATTYQPPLTHDELATHHAPQWPLLLIAAFYEGPDQPQPPAGDVALLHTHDAATYLRDLHHAGLLTLLQHSSITTPPVHALAELDATPTDLLAVHLQRLDQDLRQLHAQPGPAIAHRTHQQADHLLALLESLDHNPLPTTTIRNLLNATHDPQQQWRHTRDHLSTPLHTHLDHHTASTKS